MKNEDSEVLFSRGLFLNKRFLIFLTVFLLCIALYWGGLSNAVFRWGSQEEYSHGYLIPLVLFYILWEKRFDITAAYQGPSWWGVAVCLSALAVLLVGEISALFVLIHYSFLLFLVGLSLAALGKAARYVFPPILLLAFAVPLPYFIEVILTAKMQLLSSTIGVELIRLFGIPVYLSGNIIDLGEFKLQVVEACSGLRYLFPLICLGFIAAYFYQAALWKRAVIFLSTVPITIFMNSFRIAVTGILVENWGTLMAEGFLHDFEGWIIFLACTAILVLEIILLEKLTSRLGLFDVFGLKVEHRSLKDAYNKRELAQKPVVFLLPVLLLALMSLAVADDREGAQLPKVSLASFPIQLGNWQGTHDTLEPEVIKSLGMDDYLLVNYNDSSADTSGAPVNFYVAYYASQRKGVSPHSPKVCIPGGGWEIAEFSRTELEGFPVNRVLIRRGVQSQLVYYWFEERGDIVANEYVKKWMLFKDALLHNRTDGALVRVVTPILPDEDIGVAELRVADFVQSSNNKLMSILPRKVMEKRNETI